MAYSTIPASDEPLVATKPQGKSIKALVVGAVVASFVILPDPTQLPTPAPESQTPTPS